MIKLTAISRVSSLIVPKRFVEHTVTNLLRYAGSKDDPRVWIGTRVFLSFLVGLILFLIPISFFPLANLFLNTQFYFTLPQQLGIMIGLALFGMISTITLFYLHIAYVIDGRRRMVESILPDFLYLVGNNLKSGMTPFYAFRSAVRPEFGPLSEEIQIATQKSLGIDSFSDALREIATNIDSKVLTDTTKFFAQALRSGGKLAQLIETSANDIKQTNKLKNELITSTSMYTLFIIFVVVLASPMLLAVSIQFLVILGGLQAKIAGFSGAELTAQAGLGAGKTSITPAFMTMMAYIIIISNSILASVFIGVIGGGKIRDGLKLAPIMAIVGVILLTIMVSVLGSVLGNFKI